MKTRIAVFLLFFLIISDVDAMRPRRPRCDYTPTWKKITCWGGHGAFYFGTYIPLYSFWYKYSSTSSFHFFNDGAEWRTMDKMGHTYMAFKLASLSYSALDGTYPVGSCAALRENRKKTWIASGYSMLYLTTMEMLDGFSSGWGFSGYDIAANTIGVGLFTSQKLFCREIFIRTKFSYHATPYPNDRPEILGYTPAERLFKDYNGQTYWLTAGLPERIAKWPKLKWAAIAIGYSADGMTGGSYNPMTNENGDIIPSASRTSSYLFSLDVDWERMPCFGPVMRNSQRTKKQKALRLLFIALNTIKLPFPALEFKQGGGVRVHAFYF